MPPSKFTPTKQVAIAAAVREGVSIPDAARGNDVAPDTVKGWLKKGRANPDGTYGEFAALVDEAMEFVRGIRDDDLAESDPIPPEDELLRRLDAASKKGSVRATQLLLEARARKDADGDDEDADPFAQFDSPPDELERARRRREA